MWFLIMTCQSMQPESNAILPNSSPKHIFLNIRSSPHSPCLSLPVPYSYQALHRAAWHRAPRAIPGSDLVCAAERRRASTRWSLTAGRRGGRHACDVADIQGHERPITRSAAAAAAAGRDAFPSVPTLGRAEGSRTYRSGALRAQPMPPPLSTSPTPPQRLSGWFPG